jgi:MYXO-CTERM domain-containing protein
MSLLAGGPARSSEIWARTFRLWPYFALVILGCGNGASSLEVTPPEPAWAATTSGFETRGGSVAVRVSAQGVLELAARSNASAARSEAVTFKTLGIRRDSWRESLAPAAKTNELALELSRDRSREIFIAKPDGAEQSWTFSEQPPGHGDLVVTVGVGNAALSRIDDRGILLRQHDVAVRYGKATWVDAVGRRTPVAGGFDAGQITLTVPADVLGTTQFPATLDPTISVEQDIDAPSFNGSREDGPMRAAFCDGQYLAAWYDYGGRVFATRVQADGKVLDPGGILINGGNGQSPYGLQVACVGDTFGVVWYYYSGNLGQPTAVDFARVSSAGSMLDAPPVQLPLVPYYSLTADASNFFFVSASSGNIRAIRISPGGQVLDEPPLDIGSNYGTVYQVQALPAAQGIQVVWETSTGADYTAHLEADGTLSTPPIFMRSSSNYYLGEVAFDGQEYLATQSYHPGIGGTSNDLYAYRFNASGQVLTAPFHVTANLGSQYPIAVNAAPGGFLVTYLDGGGGIYDPSFNVSVSGDAKTIGAPISINRGAASVTKSSNGLLALYWGGSGQLFSADGTPVGSSINVASARDEQAAPAAAAIASQYLVTWARDPLGPVSANRLAADGAVLDSTPISFPPEQAFSYYPRVASDGNEYLVSYYESPGYGTAESNVRLQRVSAQGAFVGAVKVVATNADYEGHDLAYDGTAYVNVWKTRDGAIHRSRYLKASDSWEASPDLTVLGYGSAVGANAAGDLAVWLESGGLWGRFTYRDATPAKKVLLSSSTDILDPQVASDGAGYLVAWRSSTVPGIKARRWGANGAAIDASPLSLDSSFDTYSSPAVTYDGARYLVLWAGSTNRNYSVMASEISAAGLQPAISLRTDVWPANNGNTTASPSVTITSAGGQRSLAAYSVLLVDGQYGTRRVRARFLDYNSVKSCSSAAECGSGFCVDGVCCDKACGNSSPSDCQACSVAAGAAKNGTCGPAVPFTVCRASAGACDIGEVCNGTSLACPADGRAPKTFACRPSKGRCDAPEFCDGGTQCPGDGYQSASTLCRAAHGACDKEEYCTGSSIDCPANALRSAGEVCRATASTCDVAEACDGSATACPTDAFALVDKPCRDAAGPCDVAEKCSGASPTCPSDKFLLATTICRQATGVCDVAESCNGTAAACPDDALHDSATVCRPAVGACDVPEACTGANVECPDDALASMGTECRAAAGKCDVAEVCAGNTTDCPTDQQLADCHPGGMGGEGGSANGNAGSPNGSGGSSGGGAGGTSGASGGTTNAGQSSEPQAGEPNATGASGDTSAPGSAGAAEPGSVATGGTKDSSGCGCRVVEPTAGPSALPLLALLAALGRRRRQRRRAQDHYVQNFD